MSTKLMLNSFYGVMALVHFPYYDIRVAELITAYARDTYSAGLCNGCAKLVAPGTESGTGGTIGGGHEPAKAFALGQISSGSASNAAPGHLKP